MKTFKKICRKEQYELKAWLEKLLKIKYRKVVNGDGYLYAKGNVPILLTAHMDTVHKEQCNVILTKKDGNKTYLTSPQGIGGDDRCGIWMIWMVLTKTRYRPSILFCEDEEIGGVGSAKFVDSPYIDDLKELKYMIELDRANDKDAVYYDCGNEEFMNYIERETGYKEAWGSFSDISHLSPATDVASVNLSCGYYKAHTLQEYVVYEEMFDTFKVVKSLLSKAKEAEAFDYQEITYQYNNTWKDAVNSYLSGGRYNYYDDDYNDGYVTKIYEFVFNDEKGREDYDYVQATNINEAFGLFFYNNPTRCFNDIIDYGETEV